MQLGVCTDLDGKRCFLPAAAKCKICGKYTCANHKRTPGYIAPGILVSSCCKCAKLYWKYEEKLILEGIILKRVASNLCCVLNQVGTCHCGNKICGNCFESSMKPHADCRFVRCRKIISLLKSNK